MIYFAGLGALRNSAYPAPIAQSILTSLGRKYPVCVLRRSAERAQRELIQDGMAVVRITGGEFSSCCDISDPADLPGPIEELVLSCAPHRAVPTLRKLAPLLDEKSTVLLLGDRLGAQNALSYHFWPDKTSRPTFLSAFRRGQSLVMGSDTATAQNSLARKILDTPTLLLSSWLSYDKIQHIQYKNLIADSAVQPLSVLLDCDPYELINKRHEPALLQILAESCRIVQHATDIRMRPQEVFNSLPSMNVPPYLRLESQELQAKSTDFINGYLRHLAQSSHTSSLLNTMLWEMVRARVSEMKRARVSQ